MSFDYLSLPVWILLCVLTSIYLIFIGIKRRKIDRKALIVTYFTIAATGLLVALDKLINEVFIQFKQFAQYIWYIVIGLMVFIFSNLVYMGITNKGNEHSKKLFKIVEKATITGVPQGGPLSVVLSNVYLDKLDKELEQRGLRFTRYADDALIFTKSELAANRVMKSIILP